MLGEVRLPGRSYVKPVVNLFVYIHCYTRETRRNILQPFCRETFRTRIKDLRLRQQNTLMPAIARWHEK